MPAEFVGVDIDALNAMAEAFPQADGAERPGITCDIGPG